MKDDTNNAAHVDATDNVNTSKQGKPKKKVSILRIIIITIIIATFAVVGSVLGVVIGSIKSAPDASTIDLKPQGDYTSFVYDDAGVEIATFEPEANRKEYAKLSDIPVYLQQAVIASEDERFYEHNGIDIKGILRALLANIKSMSFSEGASTITQQLVKNNVLTSDKKITRKIQEQYLALQFEEIYDKDTILEYYLNTIGLSQGISGVQAASKRYFGKDVNELDLTEAAVIAGIIQWPTKYDPIRKPENNWERVQRILLKMEEQGYITPEEREAALQENPYINIKQVHEEYKSKSTRSYFVDALFNQLVADLKDLGYSETQAKKEIYGGGLIINSTCNQEMQSIVDSVINDKSMYPSNLYKVQVDYSLYTIKPDGTKIEHNAPQVILDSDSEIDAYIAQKKEEWGIEPEDQLVESVIKQPQPQAAFVLMDFVTGQIKALSGGRGDKTNLGFNYATQAERQPGSVFKVLAAYAPALDLGILSPGSAIQNDAVSYKQPDGSTWSPKNWDGNYSGSYTVRQAIANSMNVIAVKTLDQVGISTAFDYLQRFGFTTLVDSDKYLPLALGGITYGVTPLELNAAYGAIANDGTYVKPVFYTTVIKKDTGKIIIDNTGENIANNSHQVIKSSTARMLTDMMTEVVDGPSPHTGSAVRAYLKSMPVAGKTGTTTNSKDLVFAGYTPYYAATIWTGYARPAVISAYNGGNTYHLKIWSKIMSEVHKGLPYKSFPEVTINATTGVKEVTICTKSGLLATSACSLDPDKCVKGEFFATGTAPTKYCNVHSQVRVCSESDLIATDYCPSTYGVLSQEAPDGTCDIHTSSSRPSESQSEETQRPPANESTQPESTPPNNNNSGDQTPATPPQDSSGSNNTNSSNNTNNGSNGNENATQPMPEVPSTPAPEPAPTPAPEPTPPPAPEPLPPIIEDLPLPSIDDSDDFAIPQF